MHVEDRKYSWWRLATKKKHRPYTTMSYPAFRVFTSISFLHVMKLCQIHPTEWKYPVSVSWLGKKHSHLHWNHCISLQHLLASRHFFLPERNNLLLCHHVSWNSSHIITVLHENQLLFQLLHHHPAPAAAAGPPGPAGPAAAAGRKRLAVRCNWASMVLRVWVTKDLRDHRFLSLVFGKIYIYRYIYIYIYLVGGIPTPLKNMKVSWGYEIPNIWKNKS